jgi:alcohol dehydrogenase YqhD (iron-dependent ADH family)
MKFELCNPTRIVFGPGVRSTLGKEAAAVGKRALVVIGGGSVRRGGVLDAALASLHDAGLEAAVFEGVEPNPRLATVKRGAAAAVDFRADLVIALGGGSVMDAAKVMAAAVFYEGDPWDMMYHGGRKERLPDRALPVITVPTLAATGSEANEGAVITNPETAEKTYVAAECLAPRTAIVDPELTVTVPPDQTAYGISDLICHVTESYLNSNVETPLQDRMAEGVVLTAIEYGPRAVRDGRDLEARSQIQWASVAALTGWIQAGTDAPFPVHPIEHVLSAHTDVAHGAGLAIVNPAWMRFAAVRRPRKFVTFATRVWGVAAAGPEDVEAALEGIGRFESFLRSLGCPTRLSEAGIPADRIDRFAADAVRVGGNGRVVYGRPLLTAADVAQLLRSVA